MTTAEETVALCAGGTSGIGLAAAQKFASNGTRAVMVVGRREARAKQAAALIRAAAPACNVAWTAADMTTSQGALLATEACVTRFGRIDILISSAGGSDMPRLLHETALEELPVIIARITSGILLPVRAALPHMMRQGGGSIVCVASDAAKVATPGETVIGAAMAAVVMFCRGLAVEAKRHGIRVNAVTPSIVRGTPLYDALMADDFAGRLFAKAEQRALLNVATAEDVAETITFLCSPAAARITGQAISVNGGISAA